MDRTTTAWKLSERGFATVQHLVAALMAVMAFVALANLIVMQFTMAAVTGALDEGVRQGARSSDPVSSCLARVDQAIGSLLSGPLAGEMTVACIEDGIWVRAEATGVLPGWLPAVPDVPFRRSAAAPVEDPE